MLLTWVAASCTTGRAPLPSEPGQALRPPLSGAEAGKAEALARYSQFLLLQEEKPDSPHLPDVLKKAAESDPEMPAFPIWLGQAYLTRGRAEEAIPDLESAVSRFPESDALLYLLGLAYEAAERTADARRLYRELVRRSPAQPDAYARLASLALKEDRAEEAFAVLDEALRQVAEPLVILSLYEKLGEQFLASGKPWLAAVCYSRIVDRDPSNRAARERLMRSRLAADDRAGAIRELEALAALDERPEWMVLIGELHEEMDNPAAAISWYEKAIAREAPVGAWIRLALLRSRSSIGEGLGLLKHASRRFPDNPQPAVAAGALLLNLGRCRDAIDAFETAEKRIEAAGPNKGIAVSPLFFFWYGSACDQVGDTERAERLLAQSIRLFPEVTEAHNHLAYLWAQKGVNLDEAMELVRHALAKQPGNPAYLDTLGWILFRKGDHAGALAQVEKAAAVAEDDEISFHMGEILNALGRQDEAVAWWKKSAARNPKGPAAERLRAGGAP